MKISYQTFDEFSEHTAESDKRFKEFKKIYTKVMNYI